MPYFKIYISKSTNMRFDSVAKILDDP
ncbi:hypothetical protein F383_31590 [Gossypium arboreum]|uniref:Uncharacterized protein n=1 Tax=Gossypium arboreum TaxID=29729 RepID=A0A0B0MY00_GOSAR|nr:hypothetical protein F383_31590 [Gossypium arboreum]